MQSRHFFKFVPTELVPITGCMRSPKAADTTRYSLHIRCNYVLFQPGRGQWQQKVATENGAVTSPRTNVFGYVYMIFIRHYSKQNTTQKKKKKKGQTDRYIQ